MAWYDGTYTYSAKNFHKIYPYKVTENIYLGENIEDMAIVNTFVDDAKKNHTKVSKYYKPSIPSNDVFKTFYHVFPAEDAEIVKETVLQQIRDNRRYLRHSDISCINLFFKETKNGEEFFVDYNYGGGFVRLDLMKDQESLKKTLATKNVQVKEGDFILPLERYFFFCELCGQRASTDRWGSCSGCHLSALEWEFECDVFNVEEELHKAKKKAKKLNRKKHVHRSWDIMVKHERRK